MGGLLPIATTEKNGLMSIGSFLKTNQTFTSSKLIQIESWDGYSTLVFIRIFGATGLYSIDGNWGTSARFTKLSGPLNETHFKAYRGVNGNIYVKSINDTEALFITSVGANHVFKFKESDADIKSLIVLQ